MSPWVLYILTSVWVLGTPSAGQNIFFRLIFFIFASKSCKSMQKIEMFGKYCKVSAGPNLAPMCGWYCNIATVSYSLNTPRLGGVKLGSGTKQAGR